ncbi:class I SAM-dependent methyltransferase [Flavobacterium cyanobacteriorum]|uniref:class I SAM-dependent methyltransferase n=1 Tax=Flavobacterium cyanobacteriorum TaxID=2022802 RepID=UPI001FAFED2A|nr:class I SAM-dependent methyltransferase [Flavobacterium cyanobacteriorum]
MNLDLYDSTYDFICNSIKVQNAKILELGCGPGNISKYLLNKRKDFDLLGIDVAPNMIELAKINNPNGQFLQMDIRNINEIKGKFDGIISGFVLPYISHLDSNKFLNDCYELLNEGGLLYLSFVEGDPDKSDYKTASTGDRSFFYYYNLDELKQQLFNHKFGVPTLMKVDFKRSETEVEIHTILMTFKTTNR